MGVGYSRPNLFFQAKRGKFIRISRAVYRISLFPNSSLDDLFLAQITSGLNSVISHESALSLHDLSDSLPGDIHITFPRTSSRRRKGIKYHTKRFSEDEVTYYEGLKVTTVARTIIDLIESGFNPIQTKKSIDQAFDRGMITKDELLAQVKKKGQGLVRKVCFYIEGEKI
jgi:predicted transcriptional regulator of viral defense system